VVSQLGSLHLIAAHLDSNLALIDAPTPLVNGAGWTFLAGIVLFSGSLSLLSVTGRTRFGLITPLGGALLLAGWLCLALAAR
jgi:uncharacterized membrane protein YgdD (TMEM256/DUF423 family)